ncbi:flavodoxin family protein [Caballeronia temeraria]|nr:NAD(P)H-dependent oxidoreductase [Caballeronia temeraria]
MSKVLVVCFSRSGNTRALGASLAERLHADFEAIDEPVDRSGPLGYLRCLVDAVFARSVRIGASSYDVAQYDVIVIGTPVWAGTVSAPVRAWLALHRRKLPHVAFFCTQHMRGDASTFRDMTKLAGRQPIAQCAIAASVGAHDKQRAIDIFVDQIERRLTRIDNLEWAA